jgi:hypothetical protein
MSTAERALQRIRRLSKDQHSRYAQALLDSIRWDKENQPKPASANELSLWHSLPLEALEAQLVILNKIEALKLLQDIGHPIGLPSLQRNVLTEASYKKRLQRNACKVKTRLVFSYAEVLYLAKFDGIIEPPDKLHRLI